MTVQMEQEVQVAGPDAAFVTVLDRQARDAVDGALLLPGERVLRNPLAPDLVRAASERRWKEFADNGYAWDDDTRNRTWQPALTTPPQGADRAAALAEAFCEAVSLNMAEARKGLLPLVHTPPALLLLPATLWIKAIKPPATDPSAELTDRLIDALAHQSGLPTRCALTAEYRALLRRCNKVRVYEVKATMGVRHLAVSAFVTPFRFTALRGIEFAPLDPAALATVEEVAVGAFERLVARSRYTYVTIGAPAATAEAQGVESAGRFRMISVPSAQAAAAATPRWTVRHPPLLSPRGALAHFVDLLKPETRGQRAARVQACVNEILASGFRGNITISRLREQTGYGQKATYDAMFDLQDQGGFRLYRNDRVLCIMPADAASRQKPLRRPSGGRTLYYARMAAIGLLTLGASVAQGDMRNWHQWPIIGTVASWVIGWSVALCNRYWTPHRQDK